MTFKLAVARLFDFFLTYIYLIFVISLTTVH